MAHGIAAKIPRNTFGQALTGAGQSDPVEPAPMSESGGPNNNTLLPESEPAPYGGFSGGFRRIPKPDFLGIGGLAQAPSKRGIFGNILPPPTPPPQEPEQSFGVPTIPVGTQRPSMNPFRYMRPRGFRFFGGFPGIF